MAIPKTPGRDKFFKAVDELRPRAEAMLGPNPRYNRALKKAGRTVDPYRLQRAMNKRHVYWDGLEELEAMIEDMEKKQQNTPSA